MVVFVLCRIHPLSCTDDWSPASLHQIASLNKEDHGGCEEEWYEICGPEEIKAREQQVKTFKDMIRQLETELEGKVKGASTLKATVEALRKQSEGLLLEYDCLLAEHQELRNQL